MRRIGFSAALAILAAALFAICGCGSEAGAAANQVTYYYLPG